MFDIGFWELILIAVIALLVVGPERIPAVAVETGKWIVKIKKMIHAFRSGLEKEMHFLGEGKNLSKQINDLDQLMQNAPDKKSPDHKESG